MKIKGFILIVLLTFMLNSCGQDFPEQVLARMKCPVIMFAESTKDSTGKWGSFVLKDADGTFKSFVCTSAFANAISQTFNVGDTIKKCK